MDLIASPLAVGQEIGNEEPRRERKENGDENDARAAGRAETEYTENGRRHDGLYEIRLAGTDNCAPRKVVLEASSAREAEEIFWSLPRTVGMVIADIRAIRNGVYWVGF